MSGNMGLVKPILNKFVYKCNYGYYIQVIGLDVQINLDAIPNINLKFIKYINKYIIDISDTQYNKSNFFLLNI